MLLLTNSPAQKLQVVTDAASSVDVNASYMDVNGTTVTPGSAVANISTATTTDVVATPGASTTRNVKTLHLRNAHATVAVTVTVQNNSGGTAYTLHKVVLQAGEMLEYVEGQGFVQYSQSSPVVDVQVFTATGA